MLLDYTTRIWEILKCAINVACLGPLGLPMETKIPALLCVL